MSFQHHLITLDWIIQLLQSEDGERVLETRDDARVGFIAALVDLVATQSSISREKW